MKLLIVEDDTAFAATLVRRLSKHGFDCQERHQADEALHACHQFRPDYLILDMKLAADNGLMLIKPIRALLPDIRIVLLTGFASIATAVEAIQMGANDYLAKPVDTQMLLKALKGENSEPNTLKVETDIESKPMSPERLEWEHINQVLSSNDGNVSETARQLGMHRRTLQRKLQRKPVIK
ncbi:MAG: response regulator [Colwelliaceae bacterium]|nr:response regulator [Colwelliaceae bacterium]